jgi:hypothetical protein
MFADLLQHVDQIRAGIDAVHRQVTMSDWMMPTCLAPSSLQQNNPRTDLLQRPRDPHASARPSAPEPWSRRRTSVPRRSRRHLCWPRGAYGRRSLCAPRAAMVSACDSIRRRSCAELCRHVIATSPRGPRLAWVDISTIVQYVIAVARSVYPTAVAHCPGQRGPDKNASGLPVTFQPPSSSCSLRRRSSSRLLGSPK